LGCFILNIEKLVKKTNLQIFQDLTKTKTDTQKFLKNKNITNEMGVLGKLDNIMENWEKELSNSDNNLIKEDNNEIKERDNIISTSSRNDEANETLMDLKGDESEEIKLNLTEERRINFENEEETNKSENFVILPKYKKYKIPGNKKSEEEFHIEDKSTIPPADLYFPIGYTPKPVEFKAYNRSLQSQNLNQNGIISMPSDIKKHYRRIFHTGLEQARELKLRSPFTNCMIRRNNTLEQSDTNGIFSLGEGDNKIIKNYKKEDEDKSYEERMRAKKK